MFFASWYQIHTPIWFINFWKWCLHLGMKRFSVSGVEFRNFNWNFDWNFKWNFGETLLKFQWNLPWNFIAILTFWNFDEQFFEISIKLTFHSNFMANFYDLWNFVKLCYWNFMKFHWNFMYFQIVWNFGTLDTGPDTSWQRAWNPAAGPKTAAY